MKFFKSVRSWGVLGLLLALVVIGGYGQPTRLFSFAIITDIHIGKDYLDYNGFGWNDSGPGQDYPITENLKNAVANIIKVRDQYDIRFVFVTGDLTDSAERSEFMKAKEILDKLNAHNIPYIPLLGNHDVWPYYRDAPASLPGGCTGSFYESPSPNGDKLFQDIFQPQFNKLANIFKPNWVKAEPVGGRYFQNLAFDYIVAGHRYHFIGLDFASRVDAPPGCPGSEPEADLHEPGTWPWFKSHLESYRDRNPGSENRIIVLAHHPATDEKYDLAPYLGYPFNFTTTELNTLTDYLRKSTTSISGCGGRSPCYPAKILAWFGGHGHHLGDPERWLKNSGGAGGDWYINAKSIKTRETKACPTVPSIRIVQVRTDGIDYGTLLTCPAPPPTFTLSVSAEAPVGDVIVILNVLIFVDIYDNGAVIQKLEKVTPFKMSFEKARKVRLKAPGTHKVKDEPFMFERWICDGTTYTTDTITLRVDKPMSCTAYYKKKRP